MIEEASLKSSKISDPEDAGERLGQFPDQFRSSRDVRAPVAEILTEIVVEF
jgi:hypothetical protein